MNDTLRLTRALVDRLPPRTDERGPVTAEAPDEHYHQRMADKLLGDMKQPVELWVFAAGSLIWKPRFNVLERRAANIEGWRRSFCISDRRFRRCPSAPGLMMSLDRGGSCNGVVLRMSPDDLTNSLTGLLMTEPPLPPQWVDAHTQEGTVRAIAFTVAQSWPLFVPEPPLDELADMLAAAVGYVGTMAEYVLNTVTELERAGVHDAHLWRLQAMVAERLERLPARSE